MSPVPARPAPARLRAGGLKLIDWRTVAAIGLPIWAFLMGVVVTRSPAPVPALATLEPGATPAPEQPVEPDDTVPMPREIVVRTQVAAVPVVVPVVVPGEPVVVNAPASEFRLPASEIPPAGRSQTFNTKVKFHPGLPEAAEEAKTSKKMLMVLHISGSFDDPEFTQNNAQALREGALSDDAVGRFVADNFEPTYQKVGTFRVVSGVKIGGNVATYFCLSDGTVIHAVAGPLKAADFLREARWAVDLRKLAAGEAGGDPVKYRAALRKGHLERLASENALDLPANTLPKIVSGPPPVPVNNQPRTNAGRALGAQGQVHALLAYYPLPKLSQLYTIVFEDILKEKVSTLPAVTK